MPDLSSLAVVHGTFTSLAIVFMFPLAAILLRTLPPLEPRYPKPVSLHRWLQWFAWTLYMVGAIIGAIATWNITVVLGYRSFGSNAHVVIGALLSILLLGQPIWGEVHHWMYKRRDIALREERRREEHSDDSEYEHDVTSKKPGRTLVTWLHIHGGRFVILLGMINGGLGLIITSEAPFRSRLHQLIAITFYSVAAGAMGLWFFWVVIRFDWMKIKRIKSEPHGELYELRTLEGESVREPDRVMQMREAQYPDMIQPSRC